MTIDNSLDTPMNPNNEIINSVLKNPEIRRDFLCMALLKEFISDPNPNIANLFVFVQNYKAIYDSLLKIDEKDWNTLIGDMKFDEESFFDFFIHLHNSNMYGIGFLEKEDSRETLLSIVQKKEGRSLHLSHKLEYMRNVYVSEECEEKGIKSSNEIASIYEVIHNPQIINKIRSHLIDIVSELQESFQTKLFQKTGELRGEVQNQIEKVVTKNDKTI